MDIAYNVNSRRLPAKIWVHVMMLQYMSVQLPYGKYWAEEHRPTVQYILKMPTWIHTMEVYLCT